MRNQKPRECNGCEGLPTSVKEYIDRFKAGAWTPDELTVVVARHRHLQKVLPRHMQLFFDEDMLASLAYGEECVCNISCPGDRACEARRFKLRPCFKLPDHSRCPYGEQCVFNIDPRVYSKTVPDHMNVAIPFVYPTKST